MNKVGGRVILVECAEIPQLIKFYEKEEFKILQIEKDNAQMVQMIRVLK